MNHDTFNADTWLEQSKAQLIEIANYKMPFGRFSGRYLVDIPEEYYLWFNNKGFPKGKLGEYMQIMISIKENGLEHLLRPLIGMK